MVLKRVTLSEHTKKILSQLGVSSADSMTLKDLFRWLNKDEEQRKRKFLFESLKAALLKDLRHQIKPENTDKKNTQKKKSFKDYFFFFATIIAGILVSLTENLDSSLSLLGLTGLSSVYILVIGGFFSLLSLVVFFAFDLQQISNTFGIQLKQAPKLIDCYFQQLEESRGLLHAVAKNIQTTDNPDELRQYKTLLIMIERRFKAIADAQNKLETSLNNPTLKMAKMITTGIVGIFYAAGGYFGGNALVIALYALAAGMVVGQAFLPAILVGAIIAICTYGLYLGIEGASVKNWLGSRLGLDKEKIQQLSDKKTVKFDKRFLNVTKDLLDQKTSINRDIFYDKETTCSESSIDSVLNRRSSFASDGAGVRLSEQGLFSINPRDGSDALKQSRALPLSRPRVNTLNL